VTDYKIKFTIKAILNIVYKSIHITKQLSNDKITFISFCCKYVVVWSRPETIAVADEVMEHMVISVPHFPEHCLVSFLGKLFSSGICRAIEAEPDPTTNECINTLLCLMWRHTPTTLEMRKVAFQNFSSQNIVTHTVITEHFEGIH